MAQPEGARSLAFRAALKFMEGIKGSEEQPIINANLYLIAHPGGAAKVKSAVVPTGRAFVSSLIVF